jgi:hypothetical protein
LWPSEVNGRFSVWFQGCGGHRQLIGGTPRRKGAFTSSARRKEKAPMADPPQSTLQKQPTKVTTVEARQGTGPRDMVTVLVVSLLLAAVAGTAILAYFLG